MTGALIILAVTLLTGLVLYLTHRPDKSDGSDKSDRSDQSDKSDRSDSSDNTEGSGGLCCGRHEICEKGFPTREELYYEDEELDRFRQRDPASYTPEEIEEFRRVLYTLRPSEVAPWGHALVMREVPLPDALRDEWIMLCEG